MVVVLQTNHSMCPKLNGDADDVNVLAAAADVDLDATHQEVRNAITHELIKINMYCDEQYVVIERVGWSVKWAAGSPGPQPWRLSLKSA